MVFIKFSFIFLLSVTSLLAQTRFSSKSCVDSSFNMRMVQKGPLFGLIKQEFIIEKNNCLIHMTHKKYFPKEWFVDVCREPVHIKVTSATGMDVAKKTADCVKKDNSRDTSNFCSQYFDMMDVLQDDGLIFAEGDRDDLNSDHGKTYCTYLLLKKYLNESVIFSRYTEVPDIFLEKRKQNLELNDDVKLNKDDQEAKTNSLPEEKLNSAKGSL